MVNTSKEKGENSKTSVGSAKKNDADIHQAMDKVNVVIGNFNEEVEKLMGVVNSTIKNVNESSERGNEIQEYMVKVSEIADKVQEVINKTRQILS